MDSVASYSELDITQEGLCDHIEKNGELTLTVDDPSKWYCAKCNEAFTGKEDMEQHSESNPEHDCFYNVMDDCLVCTQCKRKVLAFVEKNCEPSVMQDNDDEGSSSDLESSDDSDNPRLPPRISSNNLFDGPTIDIDELVDGLRENRYKNIVVLAGAGISCASGIPDFRSANGLYRNLNKYPVPFLRDPSTIFDIHDFRSYSIPFWILAKEMFYTNHKYHPTPCHFFLTLLAQKGILRRVFTQNIDGLERQAGLDEPILIEGHGTCSKCACCVCQVKYQDNTSQIAVNERCVPICSRCGGFIKPSIVFFGEDLPDVFYQRIREDSPEVDLLIVMGTSLQVHPMCQIPYRIPAHVPRVLINNQKVGAFRSNQMNNLTLLGDCQNMVLSLIEMCGWRSEFEDLLATYKTANHVEQFLWFDQYNFDAIENNFKAFEASLLEGEKEEDEMNVDSDESSEEELVQDPDQDGEVPLWLYCKQFHIKHVMLDDGRALPVYHSDPEVVLQATVFFIRQLFTRRIVNSMKDDVPGGEENVILRYNGILLTLNQANSRCFKEILKWNFKTMDESHFLYFCLFCKTNQIK